MAARRPGLAAVYAGAAAIAIAPAGLYASQMTLRELDHVALVIGQLFFSPFTLTPTVLAIWFAGTARRLAVGNPCAEAQAVFVERFAVLVGAAFCALGWLAVERAAASAARGGGLLSGFAYLPLVAAAFLLALAAVSCFVRRGGDAPRDAPRATGQAPAAPDDPRS